jgi:two-component system sensor histidine kinase/response regulator
MKTILLIDDDELILGTFRIALRSEERRVLTAASGDEGIALARQHLPDLIISDINMPGTDGRSVLQALRADPQLSTKQIVLMTGNTTAVTPRTGMNLGADDFLVKPFSLDSLLRCVDARLRRAELNWRVEDRMILDLRSTLSSTLPHELFTPLAGILGLTEILRTEFTSLPEAEVTELLNDIHASGERLHRTLRNYLLLLELQAQSTPSPPSVWINPETAQTTVQTRIDATLERHSRQADVRMEINPGFIRGEIVHLATIIEELVDNACRFSSKGTPIEIRLLKDGVLRVSDRGRGMTPEQVERIGAFHQFDRKKHEQQGLGLGLALVKLLVARHDARFTIESSSTNGSIITVAFQTSLVAKPPCTDTNVQP